MAKLNELLKDLPIIGEYLRGEDEEEEKREPILPEVHEPEARKLLNVKPADKHRHQLKHRFSLQEHLISPDWSKERPPRTDTEREAKLFAKFSYAKPDSHQNSPLVERRKSDEQLRQDEEQKEDYLKHIKIQIDKNAEEELPSVTQTRDDEVISLIPLKMRAKSINEEEAQRNDEPRQKEEPQHFSTMDTERDSIVERELRFEKEKGLLSPLSEDEKDQTSTTNPDIRAESEVLKQQRPSYDDYEKEKQSYSSRADADDADLAAEQSKYSEERPANPEQRIAELQTPGYDRAKTPTTVVPRNEESEPDDDSAFIEAPEEKLFDSELAEKLNAPEKPAKQRAVEAMADSGGRLEDIKEEEDMIRPRFKCSSCQKKESDLLNREKLLGDETIDLEEIISYMNKHKSILEELIDQEDQKRLQIALNVARDLKLLGKEAVETLKKDLAHYFKIGNDKWKRACEEMEKLGPLVKDIESHSSSSHQSSNK